MVRSLPQRGFVSRTVVRTFWICTIQYCLLFASFHATGQDQLTSADGLWSRLAAEQFDAARSSMIEAKESTYRPTAFKLFKLDQELLVPILSRAGEDDVPAEANLVADETEITIPMPDGSYRRFRIEEASAMTPELAAKFPDIKSYRGQGIDDPTATVQIDVSPSGFRAQVLSSSGTVIVDPAGGEDLHASFLKRDNRSLSPPFECLVKSEAAGAARAPTANFALRSGHQLRTYRLAMACTGEYASRFGGTVAGAMAAINTTVNRVNGIYERELAIRLVLVGNSDQLIFTNAQTDPFANNDADSLIDQSQTVIDQRIGDANYDIGHTLSTGAGGLAGLGVVCRTGLKGQGVTGRDNPFGDPFDVDYVAHEIGHQFGGDHTFNGKSGSCSGGNRNAATAVEPGSGSTIQAYAGICGGDDLQSNSDDYFHSVSLDQITEYTTAGPGANVQITPTGNTPPTVSAGPDVAIPTRTPFVLKAVGSDPEGKPLLYSWEQRDLGPAADLDGGDDGKIPLFRSAKPDSEPVRYFPKLSDVLSNTSSPSEKLPAKSRTMRFRVTARDGQSGGGGVQGDDTVVKVIGEAGPFRITAPADATVPSSFIEVTWDVAKTNVQPISCKAVNIRLSQDGGATFPITLAANSPNDGKELVALPRSANSNLRLMVESVDNVFYAVSATAFSTADRRATVVIVRHAEKGSGDDPDLTEKGKLRALTLARLVTASGASAIYTTDTKRTQQTAKPTADALGVSPTTYAAVDEIASPILNLGDGEQVLIVGHSNTLGAIVASLGINAPINIGEAFNNLLVVTLTDSGPAIQQFMFEPDQLITENANVNSAVAAVDVQDRQSDSSKEIQPSAADDQNPSSAPPLWMEPQDTEAALVDTDRYAWRLFVALNWPADVDKRTADSNRQFGENATTVWESWKLSSGRNDEVFLDGGVSPGPWLPGGGRSSRNLEELETLPLQQLERLRRGKDQSSDQFDPSIPIGRNENHMNKEAYEFIVGNGLYNVEGQEALFAKADQLFMKASSEGRPVDFSEYRVDFPQVAKEVKAQWRPIGEQEKDRYRWEEFIDGDGNKRIYGLTALHITTKDLPNWLWMTFEHVDNPNRDGAESWVLPSRDRSAGAKGYPDGLGIDGTRWQYYRLRGAQSEFTTPTGEPTLLANSQVEQGFQTTSSCITCHARAAIGPNVRRAANRPSIFQSQHGDEVIGSTGVLEESLFVRKSFSNPVTGELQYLPLDFVWSLMRAKRSSPTAAAQAVPRFEIDIKPLFRPKDINAMKRFFDLSKYEDVKSHAAEVIERLEDGSMPCDGSWPEQDVTLFREWHKGGMPQ